MKKTVLMLILTGASAMASAADYGLSSGEDFFQFSRTPQGMGPGITLDYLKHKDHGSAGGAGLEMAFTLHSLTLAGGGKLMALDPDSGSAAAAMLGVRAALDLGGGFNLYAQAYHAPDSLASGSVTRVNDLSAGIRFNAFGPLQLEAGYRQFDIARKDGSRSRTLADGPYLGAGLTF
jgi:hypothetical protein